MVKVSPRRLAPPKHESASVLDPASDAVLSVVVAKTDGSFVFEFTLHGADWVGLDARAVKPWAVVTAEWLTAAWEVAAEALRRNLAGSAQPQDVRCGECGRVVPVPEDAPGAVVEPQDVVPPASTVVDLGAPTSPSRDAFTSPFAASAQ